MVSTKTKAVFIIFGVIFVSGIGIGAIFFFDKDDADVRIGYLSGDLHHLAFYVAHENGFYEDEGIEIKAITGNIPRVFEVQILSYLKATKCKVGLLINFGNKSCQIRRLIFKSSQS